MFEFKQRLQAVMLTHGAAADTPGTLRLSVDNVANERYWASACDAFSPALLQGGPRAVKASISADF